MWLIRLQDDMTANLKLSQVGVHSCLGEVSSEGEHLITDQVRPDSGRSGAVEVERLHSFLDVGAQLVPGIALREDALRQTLGGEPPVGILRHFKNNFAHYLKPRLFRDIRQGTRPPKQNGSYRPSVVMRIFPACAILVFHVRRTPPSSRTPSSPRASHAATGSFLITHRFR
jgi:hypothetical protein